MVILRFTGWIMNIAKAAMAAAFATMILITLLQVMNRYAFNLGLFWTEELIILLLVWATLLGLPVQLWLHEEIVVDVLAVPQGWMQTAKSAIAKGASILFCAALAWTGLEFALRGWPVVSPALKISRFWFFVPIPLSAALAVLALVLRPRGASTGGFE